MRTKQLGVSLLGLLMASVVIIAVLLVGMKLAPSYIEFFAIKKAVNSIASEKNGASVAEIRKSFDNHATIDDISTIKGSDLEITKEGGSTVIRAAYRREVPLVANVGMYIDFVAEGK
ncbi:MAG TPA: DUF4845 domain-containing protein [Burkholderiales bacterium]|jgi:hypothetical protein|nr:DUF4845 domain-containing protein [Burkholderiales bacterium]HEX2651233.1 DUF4845 domain-containing protein [Burkholderiales bacterium]